jgi:adenylosuccinate lyase
MIRHQAEQDKRQDEQAKKIEAVKTQHEEDVKAIKTEQTLITYGVLACLKGLREQGCDGAVTDAIDKIDKYLNKAAHGQI